MHRILAAARAQSLHHHPLLLRALNRADMTCARWKIDMWSILYALTTAFAVLTIAALPATAAEPTQVQRTVTQVKSKGTVVPTYPLKGTDGVTAGGWQMAIPATCPAIAGSVQYLTTSTGESEILLVLAGANLMQIHDLGPDGTVDFSEAPYGGNALPLEEAQRVFSGALNCIAPKK